MAFCGKCGTKLEDGVKFCPTCGLAADGTAAPPPPVYTAPVEQADAEDAERNKVMGVLAYIIFLVPLLAAPKDSKFSRFHANQGLVLALSCIAYAVAYAVITAIIGVISWRVGLVASTILGLVYWVFPVFSILGIVNVCKGQMKELPLIGRLRILK